MVQKGVARNEPFLGESSSYPKPDQLDKTILPTTMIIMVLGYKTSLIMIMKTQKNEKASVIFLFLTRQRKLILPIPISSFFQRRLDLRFYSYHRRSNLVKRSNFWWCDVGSHFLKNRGLTVVMPIAQTIKKQSKNNYPTPICLLLLSKRGSSLMVWRCAANLLLDEKIFVFP